MVWNDNKLLVLGNYKTVGWPFLIPIDRNNMKWASITQSVWHSYLYHIHMYKIWTQSGGSDSLFHMELKQRQSHFAKHISYCFAPTCNSILNVSNLVMPKTSVIYTIIVNAFVLQPHLNIWTHSIHSLPIFNPFCIQYVMYFNGSKRFVLMSRFRLWTIRLQLQNNLLKYS